MCSNYVQLSDAIIVQLLAITSLPICFGIQGVMRWNPFGFYFSYGSTLDT